MHAIDNPLNLRLFLSKLKLSTFKKTFIKKLAKDLPCTSITPNKLNIKVYFLISTINMVITLAILKANLFPKLVLRFDKEYKEIQI